MSISRTCPKCERLYVGNWCYVCDPLPPPMTSDTSDGGGAGEVLNRVYEAGGWAWDAIADPDFYIRLNRGYDFTGPEWESAYEKQVEHAGTILAKLRAAEAERDALRAQLAAAGQAVAERDRMREAVRWIPVSERLPDSDRDVLTLNDEGERCDGEPWPLFCEISNYVPDRVGTMIDGEVRPFPWNSPCVTHWMELPRPDAGGEGKA